MPADQAWTNDFLSLSSCPFPDNEGKGFCPDFSPSFNLGLPWVQIATMVATAVTVSKLKQGEMRGQRGINEWK